MKKLIIEIPDYLHRALKTRVFADGTNMKRYITEILIDKLDLRIQQDEKK